MIVALENAFRPVRLLFSIMCYNYSMERGVVSLPVTWTIVLEQTATSQFRSADI